LLLKKKKDSLSKMMIEYFFESKKLIGVNK